METSVKKNEAEA